MSSVSVSPPLWHDLYYRLCKQSVDVCCCLATVGVESNRISVCPVCLCARMCGLMLEMCHYRLWSLRMCTCGTCVCSHGYECVCVGRGVWLKVWTFARVCVYVVVWMDQTEEWGWERKENSAEVTHWICHKSSSLCLLTESVCLLTVCLFNCISIFISSCGTAEGTN